MLQQDQYKGLWLKILIGMVLGAALGIALSPYGGALVSEDTARVLAPWIKLPGILFLGLIQMVVIPLILCSIILGITQSGELGFLKKLGARLVAYFIVTTFIAISIGVFWVSVIQPGSFMDEALISSFVQRSLADEAQAVRVFDTLSVPDRISNLIPVNVPSAVVEKNLLQIVIAAMLVGVALVSIGKEKSQPIVTLCQSGQDVAMCVIGWAMKIAPYAVFALVCDITIALGLDALVSMGIYMFTVILGLLSMLCVYVFLAWSIGKVNPVAFFHGLREAQLLGFSTSSSAATMPFTLACAEDNLKVSPKIARFVVPLGATINMDGTALYQAIAALFLVQVFGSFAGVELSTTDIILLMVTTVGASIGTPATPGVGIVVLATILAGIGLPPAAIGFILGVDRLLDMCRTSINVTGDLTASLVMQRLLK